MTQYIWQSTKEVEKNSSFYSNCKRELTSRYGEDIGRVLSEKLKGMIYRADDLCTDNFRVADWKNKKEKLEYIRKQKNGCCGYADQEVVYYKNWKNKTGRRKFMIGFNFGH